MQIQDFSVVVPTRNEEKNIPRFLASIPEEVILVVVDSSDDKTIQVISRLRPNHTILIHCPVNIAEARHLGAQASCTPWVIFTDADVSFSGEYFDRLLKNGDVDAIYGAKTSQDDYRWYYSHFVRWQRVFDKIGIPAVSGSNLIVKRKSYMESGGFNLELKVNEDTELGFRLKKMRYKIRFDPELVVYTHDQRRLKKGVFKKDIHTLLRCTLLYFNLMPISWRTRDQGYWS